MKDEQATHMQLRGLDLQELETQRAEVLPARIVMRRRKWRRGWRKVPGTVGCVAIMPIPEGCDPGGWVRR